MQHSPERIRVIAICVFKHEDSIFVLEGIDEVKPETFYRPLGGGVEFGETGRDAVAREVGEEINAEVCDLRYLSMIESVFTHNGQSMHEIVLVYEGRFVDPAMNDLKRVITGNEEGTPFKARWIPLDAFRRGELILYPSELLQLIEPTE